MMIYLFMTLTYIIFRGDKKNEGNILRNSELGIIDSQ